MNREITITSTILGCELQYCYVTKKTLADGKNQSDIVSDFAELRKLFWKAKLDPYLSFLQAKASDVFQGVVHNTACGAPAQDIQLRCVEVGDGAHGWRCLPESDGLSLILDGWVRLWVDLGFEPESKFRIADVVRGPVLIGDRERPSAMGRVDVKGMQHDQKYVYYLHVPQALVDSWDTASKSVFKRRCKDHFAKRNRTLLPWLGAGVNNSWRVIRWLLDEEKRESIWIPKIVLGFKLLAGGEQKSDNPEVLHRTAQGKRTEASKIIKALVKKGVLAHRVDPTVKKYDLTVVDQARLRDELCAAAFSVRKSPAAK